MISRLLAVLALAAASLPALAQDTPPDIPLTRQQTDLIGLITYLQVARRACGYVVEPSTMSMLARDGRITLETDIEQKVAAEKLQEHYQTFGGVKQVLECAHALEQFGPEGKRVKGLLKMPEE